MDGLPEETTDGQTERRKLSSDRARGQLVHLAGRDIRFLGHLPRGAGRGALRTGAAAAADPTAGKSSRGWQGAAALTRFADAVAAAPPPLSTSPRP